MNKKKIEKHFSPSKISLNFWQLTFIIFASTGLPGIFLGSQIAKQHGVDNCIGSFFIGNLILWLIGMIIVSMSSEKRFNAISNIKNYLGSKISITAALCIGFAFLSWYIIQLNTGNSAITTVLKDNADGGIINLRTGAALGICATLLITGGLRIIKFLTLISGIIFFCFLFYFLINSEKIILTSLWGFSKEALGAVIFFLLAGIINLPTFFKYSRSKADSFLAISLIFLLLTFMQISSIWIGSDDFFISILKKFPNYENFFKILFIIIIVTVTVNNLLVNIFFASACWEAMISKISGAKEYAIIGLLGTAAFTFLQVSKPMQFLMDLANYFISILSVILILTFVGHIIRANALKKIIGSISWIVGCFIATALEYYNPEQKMHTLTTAIGISCLIYLISIFMEETIWSIKRLIKRKK